MDLFVCAQVQSWPPPTCIMWRNPSWAISLHVKFITSQTEGCRHQWPHHWRHLRKLDSAALSCCNLVYIQLILRDVCAAHVARHTSHLTRHTSHVTRHTSHVTRRTSLVARRTSHDWFRAVIPSGHASIHQWRRITSFVFTAILRKVW